jgi:hypothetical protein
MREGKVCQQNTQQKSKERVSSPMFVVYEFIFAPQDNVPQNKNYMPSSPDAPAPVTKTFEGGGG